MREEIRPTLLPALEMAEELIPPPLSELAGLPRQVRVQSLLFDALVFLAAARQEAKTIDGNAVRWATPSIDKLCHELDALLERFAS